MAFVMRNLRSLIINSNQIRYFTHGDSTNGMQSSSGPSSKPSSSKARDKLPFDFSEIPEKPKLPRSPFAIYFEHRFVEIQKDSKDLKKNDAKKVIEEEWNKLEMKQPYEELSAKEHHEYKDKKQVYSEFVNRKITIKEMLIVLDAFNKMQAQKAKAAKGTKPKRPVSAYGLFFKEYSDSVKASGLDSPKMSEVAEKWKNLPDDEREKYQQQSEKLRQESIEAIKQWKEDNSK